MNRVFVSPGVYTHETELRFVSQSLGVTSVGLVGETLRGAAFVPTLVTNYTNDYAVKFGGVNPLIMEDSTGKFKYPLYEMSYIAKEYLKQSSSLYVTRVLGLSGYDAGKAYTLKIGGNVSLVLRSRGSYSSGSFVANVKTVTTETATINSITDVITLKVETNPTGSKTVKFSLDPLSSNYVVNVLGRNNFDSNEDLFVDVIYDNIIKSDVKASTTVVLTTVNDLNKYNTQYQSAKTPWVISENIGDKAEKLFRFHTISDGVTSRNEVKFSISDINIETKTFNVAIRSYYDTDRSPVILERYTRCSLNENSKDFIGIKMGTKDGKYKARSKYVLVEINEDVNVSLFLPYGFMGYEVLGTGGLNIDYKTKYDPQEVIRKSYLGINNINSIDDDIFKFTGLNKVSPTNGFHCSDSSTLNINGEVLKMTGSKMNDISHVKFTFVAYGGFDGWDMFRKYRTNEDSFIINKFYTSSGLDIAGLKKAGLEPLTLSNKMQASTADYYAYLEGVRTFANPEDKDINVLAVAGIDYGRNASLINDVIEVVEIERADCVFIMNAPNVDINEAVSLLEDSGIVSSYTATYYPWKQFNDSENGLYLNISPTMDVIRNIAMVDKKRVPWLAVAGVNRGSVECVRMLDLLTRPERDDLYTKSINPICRINKYGDKIWGNRTLHEDSDAALSSLNVRRLILEARKLVAIAAIRLVFDQNDDNVVQDFYDLVNPILANMKTERGISEFKIEVDRDIEAIQRKELNARILIKPIQAVEYIIIEFGVTDQGVSFDDV